MLFHLVHAESWHAVMWRERYFSICELGSFFLMTFLLYLLVLLACGGERWNVSVKTKIIVISQLIYAFYCDMLCVREMCTMTSRKLNFVVIIAAWCFSKFHSEHSQLHWRENFSIPIILRNHRHRVASLSIARNDGKTSKSQAFRFSFNELQLLKGKLINSGEAGWKVNLCRCTS